MEAVDSPDVNETEGSGPAAPAEMQARLSEIFGYKAEWLKEQIFDLFSEPTYVPELTQSRPCVLIGGRGTGKTTVLRALSYEGQFALKGRRVDTIDEWPFFGMYYRVNRNRVEAFRGPELTEREWTKLFAHYMNLVLCDQALRFLSWYALHLPDSTTLSEEACNRVSDSLHLGGARSLRDLAHHSAASRVVFEAYINNVADGNRPPLSLQAAPVDVLFEEIAQLPQFRERAFFYLIDEYENFLDDQQEVMNTFLKHAAAPYTFKIGVRELGWRRRGLIGGGTERLSSPADYVRVDIAEKLEGAGFRSFAQEVCNQRLDRLAHEYPTVIRDVRALLPSLSNSDEAELLGVVNIVEPEHGLLLDTLRDDKRELVAGMSLLEFYVMRTWALTEGKTTVSQLEHALQAPADWANRLNNYSYSLLFSIRRGKRGIRKYYAGWETFLLLAANNIRYLMELVDQSLLFHVREGTSLSTPVAPRSQTKAAQAVGKKNLSELEGLDVSGAKLTKLVLGLGRVFQVMAEDPIGKTPEVNQFHLVDRPAGQKEPGSSTGKDLRIDELLTAAVTHLALLRQMGNKLGDEGDTRDYDYMPHPIFSAYFGFSHRRKRKMMITNEELLGLVQEPKETIRGILARTGRTPDDAVPEQLMLFGGYYGTPA